MKTDQLRVRSAVMRRLGRSLAAPGVVGTFVITADPPLTDDPIDLLADSVRFYGKLDIALYTRAEELVQQIFEDEGWRILEAEVWFEADVFGPEGA